MTDAVPVMLNEVSTPAGVTEGWTPGGVRKCEVAAAVRFRGDEHAWVGRWGLYGAICQAGARVGAGGQTPLWWSARRRISCSSRSSGWRSTRHSAS